MIFANGRLLPDSQLSQVLEELEEAVNETRRLPGPWSRETVISALQAVGGAAGSGRAGPAHPPGTPVPGGAPGGAHIRPLLRREALEYKLAVELGIRSTPFRSGPSAAPRPVPLGTCSMSPPAM